MDKRDALQIIKEKAQEMLNSNSYTWGDWFCIFHLASVGLGEIEPVTEQDMAWAMKKAYELGLAEG